MAPTFKANPDQFRSALVRHHRPRVFHWTPASQLPSILEHGILCRHELERRGIPCIQHGYGRAGKEQDFAGHVCVSFYPQKGMMKSEVGALAVIVIESEIIITENAFYCAQNTAKSEYEFDDLVSHTSVDDLEGLFKGPFEWELIDWQAEVWIPEVIAVNHFREIWFRNEDERDQALEACSGIAPRLPRVLLFAVGPKWAFPSL